MHDGDAVLSELAACTVLDAARLHMETGCELTLYRWATKLARSSCSGTRGPRRDARSDSK